jgi:hypothetical protein
MRRCARGLALAIVGILATGCSKAPPIACTEGGVQHDDQTVNVLRGDGNSIDFDRCVAEAGDCYSLCIDTKGNPGNGWRVNILTCDRTSVEGIDAGGANDGGGHSDAAANVKPDAAVVTATSVTLHIVYDVYPCSPAD